MEQELNFLLMGKTGHGKSATGNSILRQPCFKVSARHPTTPTVECGFSQFGNYTLLVVDGPGLEDSNIKKVDDTTAAGNNLSKALAMCDGGVDAFLLVIRFGCRFTEEDRSALEDLKPIFGPSYLDHVIVVVTCGDVFQLSKEEEEIDISFSEWCRKQRGEFHHLYEDCAGRFVLFNNREKDEEKRLAQVQELVQLAQGLRDKHGRYTSLCFKDAETERQKLIVETKAPQLTREIQEKVSLLGADIEHLSEKSPSNKVTEGIRTRIEDLKREMEVQDKGNGGLTDVRELVKSMQEYLDDVTKLHIQTKNLAWKTSEVLIRSGTP